MFEAERDDRRSIRMPVPVTGPIQFVPPGGVYLTVDSVTDPGGGPADVIDVDLGFKVSGTVVLPLQGHAETLLLAFVGGPSGNGGHGQGGCKRSGQDQIGGARMHGVSPLSRAQRCARRPFRARQPPGEEKRDYG